MTGAAIAGGGDWTGTPGATSTFGWGTGAAAALLLIRSGETVNGGNPDASAAPQKQHINSGTSFIRVLSLLARKRLPPEWL